MSKGKVETSEKIGFDTRSQMKAMIISHLNRSISLNEFDDPDEDFWRECLTFMNIDGKLEAQGKSKGQKTHDDRVMDRAIALWIARESSLPYKKREVNEEYERVRKLQRRPGRNGSLVGWVVR